MTSNTLFLMGSVKDFVGKFTKMQMIAIGVVALLAVLLGVLIGGLAFYRSGLKKGKRKGIKDAVGIAMKKAEENNAAAVERARAESAESIAALEKEKQAAVTLAANERQEKEAAVAERDAAIAAGEESKKALEELRAEMERTKQESALLRSDAETAKREIVQAKTDAELARIEREKAETDAIKAKQAAEKAKEDAERKKREAEELRLQRDESEAKVARIPERRTNITLLNKPEILGFAGDLEEHLPASVYERGGELPDSCRVGICTFLLVYERKGMVKLVLRLDRASAAKLEKSYTLFTKAVYPKGGDWYKWILSSEVTDLAVVTEAIRAAYEYTYSSNYDATGEINVEMANRDENAINEAIVRYKDLPDRDFIVASDAMDGAVAYRLYGKKQMTDYAKKLAPAYPVKVTKGEGDLAPNTCKVAGKTFLMAYEKDGVAKMIFRLSEEDFAALKAKHSTADVSPFPKAKGYHWYVVYIDETFSANADIEEIIKSACAYVYGLRDK